MGIANTAGHGGADRLLVFYDDYVEFQESCSFLCDAISSMAAEDDRFEGRTVSGIRQFCQQVKDQAENLRRELERLQMADRGASTTTY